MVPTSITPKKIAVVGELNVDLVASGLNGDPIFGGEIIGNDFEMTLGSASAIFACGAAQLGNEVTFVSSAGNDHFGAFCVEELERKGVSTQTIERKSDEKTGVTIVLSNRRDRALITFPGTTSTFGFSDALLDHFSGKDHLHLTSYFLQATLQPDFSRLMSEAKTRGLSVSFDPNADPSGEWGDEIFEAIELTDILFVNEPEALTLSGKVTVHDAIAFLEAKCPCVVIKQGSRGATATREDERVSVSGFEISAMDTTGAGDSFAAGFVTGYLNDLNLSACLQLGNACGALSTRGLGGTNFQPNYKEAVELISGNQKAA